MYSNNNNDGFSLIPNQYINTDQSGTIYTPPWTAIAMSGDGRYQTAIVSGGYIYSSSDYGKNWLIVTSFTKPWKAIAMSYTGQYQTAVVFRGSIYISDDYGQTWREIVMSQSWTSVSMSYTGQVQYATAAISQLGGVKSIGNPGAIFTSSTYGVTWTTCSLDTPILTGEWIQVDYSKSYEISGYTIIDPVYQLPEASIPPYWSLVGSNDKSQWFLLDTVTNSADRSDGGILNWTNIDTSSFNLPFPPPEPLTEVDTRYHITIPYRKVTRPLSNIPPFSSYRLIMGSQVGVTGIGGLSFQGIGTFVAPNKRYVGTGKNKDFSGYDLSGNGTFFSLDYSVISNASLTATVSWSWRSPLVTMDQYVPFGFNYSQIPPAGILCTSSVSYLCLRNEYATSTTITPTYPLYSLSVNWTSIAMTSDARIIAATYIDAMPSTVPYGLIYDVSNNNITTTREKLVYTNHIPNQSFMIDTKNKTKKYQPLGGVMISTDYGKSWSPHTTFSYYSQAWTSISMSADGNIQWVTGPTSTIYSNNNTIQQIRSTPPDLSDPSPETLYSFVNVSGDGSTAFIVYRNNDKWKIDVYNMGIASDIINLFTGQFTGPYTGIALSYNADIFSLCAPKKAIQTFTIIKPEVPIIGQWSNDTFMDNNDNNIWISMDCAMSPREICVATNSNDIYLSQDTSWNKIHTINTAPIQQVCISDYGNIIVALTPTVVYINSTTFYNSTNWEFITALTKQTYTSMSLVDTTLYISYYDETNGGMIQYDTITKSKISFPTPSIGIGKKWSLLKVSKNKNIYMGILLNSTKINNSNTKNPPSTTSKPSGSIYRILCTEGKKCDLSGGWTSTNSKELSWVDLAMSMDGRYQSVVADNEGIYYSTTFGAEWIKSDAPHQLWKKISVSYMGQYQVAVAMNGLMYISSNYGQNWLKGPLQTQPQPWTTVLYSPDASAIKASYVSGGIQRYVWTTKPTAINCTFSPWINIDTNGRTVKYGTTHDEIKLMKQQRTLLAPALFDGMCDTTDLSSNGIAYRSGIGVPTITPQVCSTYSSGSELCPTSCIYEYVELYDSAGNPICSDNGFIMEQAVILEPGNKCPVVDKNTKRQSNNVCPLEITAKQIDVGVASLTFPASKNSEALYKVTLTGLSGEYGYEISGNQVTFIIPNLVDGYTYSYMIEADISNSIGINTGQFTMNKRPPSTVYPVTAIQTSSYTGLITFTINPNDNINQYELTLTNNTNLNITYKGFKITDLNTTISSEIKIKNYNPTTLYDKPTLYGIIQDQNKIILTYTISDNDPSDKILLTGTYNCFIKAINEDGTSTSTTLFYMNRDPVKSYIQSNISSPGIATLTFDITGNDPNATYKVTCLNCVENQIRTRFSNKDNTLGTFTINGVEDGISYNLYLQCGVAGSTYNFSPPKSETTFKQPSSTTIGIGTAQIEFPLLNEENIDYRLDIPLPQYSVKDQSGNIYSNTQYSPFIFCDLSNYYCLSGNNICITAKTDGTVDISNGSYVFDRTIEINNGSYNSSINDFSGYSPCLLPYAEIDEKPQLIPRLNTYKLFPMDEWLSAGLLITFTNKGMTSYDLSWNMMGSDGISIDLSGLQLPRYINTDASGTIKDFLLQPLQGFNTFINVGISPVQFMSYFWSSFTITLDYTNTSKTNRITTTIQLPTMTYTTISTEINPPIIIDHGNNITSFHTIPLLNRNGTGFFTVSGLTDGQYYPYSITATTPTQTYTSSPETIFIQIKAPTLPSVLMQQTDVGTVVITFPIFQNEPTTTYDVSYNIIGSPSTYNDVSGSIITADSITWNINTGNYTHTSCSTISNNCQVIYFDPSGNYPIQVSSTSGDKTIRTFTITNLHPNVTYRFTLTAKTQALSTTTNQSVTINKMPPLLQWPTNQPNITQYVNGHVQIVTQINDNPFQKTFTPPSTFYNITLQATNNPESTTPLYRVIDKSDELIFLKEGIAYYTVTVTNSFVQFDIYQLSFPPEIDNADGSGSLINTSYNYKIEAINRDGTTDSATNQFVLTYPYKGKVDCRMKILTPSCDNTQNTCQQYAITNAKLTQNQKLSISQPAMNGGKQCGPENLVVTCDTNNCPLSYLDFDKGVITFKKTNSFESITSIVGTLNTNTIWNLTNISEHVTNTKNISIYYPFEQSSTPPIMYSYGTINNIYKFSITVQSSNSTLYNYDISGKINIPPITINKITQNQDQSISIDLSNIAIVTTDTVSYYIKFTPTKVNVGKNPILFIFPLNNNYLATTDTIVFQPQEPILIQSLLKNINNMSSNEKLPFDTYDVTVSLQIKGNLYGTTSFENFNYTTSNCPPGYYCKPGDFQKKCPLGTYNNNKGQTSCKECPTGTFCNVGSTSATPCQVGSYCSNSSTINLCTPGSYCPAGSSSVTPCPTGTYNPLTGQTSLNDCQSCSAGTFNSQTGQTSCQTCPAGNYCTSNATSPTQCPVGTYNPNSGAYNNQSCSLCSLGYDCQAGSTNNTTPCPAGYYCNQSQNGLPDWALNLYGSTVQAIPCPAGTYNSQTGQSACTSCTYSTYSCPNSASTTTNPMLFPTQQITYLPYEIFNNNSPLNIIIVNTFSNPAAPPVGGTVIYTSMFLNKSIESPLTLPVTLGVGNTTITLPTSSGYSQITYNLYPNPVIPTFQIVIYLNDSTSTATYQITGSSGFGDTFQILLG